MQSQSLEFGKVRRSRAMPSQFAGSRRRLKRPQSSALCSLLSALRDDGHAAGPSGPGGGRLLCSEAPVAANGHSASVARAKSLHWLPPSRRGEPAPGTRFFCRLWLRSPSVCRRWPRRATRAPAPPRSAVSGLGPRPLGALPVASLRCGFCSCWSSAAWSPGPRSGGNSRTPLWGAGRCCSDRLRSVWWLFLGYRDSEGGPAACIA